MNSRQLQFLLIALIAVGIAAVIARLVVSGGDDSRLTGLLPMSPDVVDTVIIRSDDGEARIQKINADTGLWQVGQHEVDAARFTEFWATVARFDGAQLVSTNPANHARMGVAEGDATDLLFMLGNAVQEQFIVGVSPDENVALCYLRKRGQDNTYAVPCRFSDLFESDRDAWRDPVIMDMPLEVVGGFTVRYPSVDVNTAIEISVEDNLPVVVTGGSQSVEANIEVTSTVLSALRQLFAVGFATDAEASSLNFDLPDISILIEPIQDIRLPAQRLLFIQRDAQTYWVRNSASSIVCIVGNDRVAPLLVDLQDFLASNS
ncbi:MAG: DUF4340 domain-containing protein [Chloroflexi bacterium]|nr:DUF4340 domain-containing protein [Chloroflexota bacterium]